FYATIVNMRAPGMSWGRIPLFIWAILVYAILLIVALPVIAAAVTMLLTDRHFGTHWFDPTAHGSPVLWQHLFWLCGHPEVYIMVLLGFGIISEVIPVFSRKPIVGYKAVAALSAVIAVVAHFHYTIFGGAIFPIFAGLYYWFPKMSGRFLNERLGKISFWLIFIGFNATFLVQHALGLSGMPRRIYTYEPNFGWSTYNMISTVGAFILGVGV